MSGEQSEDGEPQSSEESGRPHSCPNCGVRGQHSVRNLWDCANDNCSVHMFEVPDNGE